MSARERPNVIIVYTDQQRYDTLGANGNPLVCTPSLDGMARKGVNFSRAYVTTPLCVPSRVAFFTGRYNHANLSYSNERLMFDRETDFVSLFKESGYRTALVGKNHCFPQRRCEEVFDWRREAGHTRFLPALTETEEKINELRRDKMQAPFADDPFPPEDSITGSLFRSAREYLDRPSDEPFFMWLSVPDPHPPYMVCEPYATMYDDADVPPPAWEEGETDSKPYRQRLIVEWDRYGREYPDDGIRRLIRTYWGMVSYIDDELGRLLERLRSRGLAERTIVVFTSDHGDYMGEHRMIRKGPHLYEALVRVPLVIRWPGHIRPRATDAMVANIDVMPTLCELIGVDVEHRHQGRSFAPLLRGETDAHRDGLFMEHGEPGPVLRPGDLSPEEHERLGSSKTHHLCPAICRGRVKGVRTDRWKYCVTPGDVDELYDLESDPNELHNLASEAAHRDVVLEHRGRILEWLVETEDAGQR